MDGSMGLFILLLLLRVLNPPTHFTTGSRFQILSTNKFQFLKQRDTYQQISLHLEMMAKIFTAPPCLKEKSYKSPPLNSESCLDLPKLAQVCPKIIRLNLIQLKVYYCNVCLLDLTVPDISPAVLKRSLHAPRRVVVILYSCLTPCTGRAINTLYSCILHLESGVFLQHRLGPLDCIFSTQIFFIKFS